MQLYATAAVPCAHRRAGLALVCIKPAVAKGKGQVQVCRYGEKFTSSDKQDAIWQNLGVISTYLSALFGVWTRAPLRPSGVQHVGGYKLQHPAASTSYPQDVKFLFVMTVKLLNM
eukprot:5740050-Pleurochrysis_carterae.AAC.3